MSEAASPDGPPTDAGRTDALASAKQALDAAREAVGALVTVRARALQEGIRLRSRAEAPDRAELVEDAALQERRAAALEPRIEQLRDLARRAEVAYEALRSDRDRAAQSSPAGPAAPDGSADPEETD